MSLHEPATYKSPSNGAFILEQNGDSMGSRACLPVRRILQSQKCQQHATAIAYEGFQHGFPSWDLYQLVTQKKVLHLKLEKVGWLKS